MRRSFPSVFGSAVWMQLFTLEEQLDSLPDEEERARRGALLHAIEESLLAYDEHLWDYAYEQKWQQVAERGVVCCPWMDASSLKGRWSKLFAATVDAATKKKIYYQQFRWHIFSFEVVACKAGDEARRAFDQCRKHTVYGFYQCEDTAFSVGHPMLLRAEDFDFDDDIYLFDPVERWTYVHTHEESCGPYFYQLP